MEKEHMKFWQEFFHLYKELPALWRIKSTEYSDRTLKANCYTKLVAKLKEIYPDADREMVVRKINNFRTSYRKELRRKRESQRYGRVHKPTLWYFDCLSFLYDQDECGCGRSLVSEEENTEEKKPTTQKPINHQQFPAKRNHNIKESDEEENLPSSSKKLKLSHRYIQPIKLSHEEQKQAQLDADILAKSWAVQYKEMQGNQKIIARKIISDILFHGCIGTLNMSHTVDIQEILLRSSSEDQLMHHVPVTQSNMDSNDSDHDSDQEFIRYESVRESSPIPYNSSSRSVSPSNLQDGQEIEIKFELP
ncbi:uncharacterized protein LOC124420698 isoform X1 [Lucilia cuprina]|uniref:uncharacterized protein LOC124420698 isoform X1 n=1 Tax=Lucilia cuprina TaxID=7375 RepID=UPI001F06CEAD|nr:uncharacterized protein LOC124420698 isoform X1 [Lucilia cuprina]